MRLRHSLGALVCPPAPLRLRARRRRRRVAPRAVLRRDGGPGPDRTEIARMGAARSAPSASTSSGARFSPRSPRSSTGATTTPSSGRPRSRASGCCRPCTAPRRGRPSRTNYPPARATSASSGPSSAGRGRALRRQRDLLDEHPSIPPAAGHLVAALERAQLPSFWYRKPNPKQYVHLLRVFHGAVKAGDPARRSCSPGSSRPRGAGQARDRPRPLPDRRSTGQGARSCFDAAAIHPYAGHAEPRPGAVRDAAQDHGPVQGQEGEALGHRGRLGERAG